MPTVSSKTPGCGLPFLDRFFQSIHTLPAQQVKEQAASGGQFFKRTRTTHCLFSCAHQLVPGVTIIPKPLAQAAVSLAISRARRSSPLL